MKRAATKYAFSSRTIHAESIYSSKTIRNESKQWTVQHIHKSVLNAM